jgi:hypothetical protein
MDSIVPPPSPSRIFGTLTAFQNSFMLKAAIDFDVFTAIGEGANTAQSLAARCRASEKGMRVLCDALTMLEFLTKSGDAYALTPEAAMFLSKHSPAYLGGASGFILNDTVLHAFTSLEAAVRLGGTTMPGDGTVSDENPVWVDFARGMGPMMYPGAQDIAARIVPPLFQESGGSPKKVLDVAAGHGMFGIGIAQHHPQAEIVALDWAPVLAVAQENAARLGVAGRIRSLPGDAFTTDLGSGYDLILIANFLHHFDIATNTSFLRKVKAALGAVVSL